MIAYIQRAGEKIMEVHASSRELMTERLLTALLTAHAEDGHTGLSYTIADEEAGGYDFVDIRCECLQEKCGKRKLKYEARIPRWLVATATLAFHTNHEGHPLRVVCDGYKIESPFWRK